jgi:hypothetical protein
MPPMTASAPQSLYTMNRQLDTTMRPEHTCDLCNDAAATRFYRHPWDQGELGVCPDCDPSARPRQTPGPRLAETGFARGQGKSRPAQRDGSCGWGEPDTCAEHPAGCPEPCREVA